MYSALSLSLSLFLSLFLSLSHCWRESEYSAQIFTRLQERHTRAHTDTHTHTYAAHTVHMERKADRIGTIGVYRLQIKLGRGSTHPETRWLSKCRTHAFIFSKPVLGPYLCSVARRPRKSFLIDFTNILLSRPVATLPCCTALPGKRFSRSLSLQVVLHNESEFVGISMVKYMVPVGSAFSCAKFNK